MTRSDEGRGHHQFQRWQMLLAPRPALKGDGGCTGQHPHCHHREGDGGHRYLVPAPELADVPPCSPPCEVAALLRHRPLWLGTLSANVWRRCTRLEACLLRAMIPQAAPCGRPWHEWSPATAHAGRGAATTCRAGPAIWPGPSHNPAAAVMRSRDPQCWRTRQQLGARGGAMTSLIGRRGPEAAVAHILGPCWQGVAQDRRTRRGEARAVCAATAQGRSKLRRRHARRRSQALVTASRIFVYLVFASLSQP